MITKDVLSIAYVLLGNISEKELDYIVALEQYSNVLAKMKMERILAFKNQRIYKGSLVFTDETGTTENDLVDYGTQVFLRFNNLSTEETTVSMLDLYRDAGRMAVAFWTDAESNTDFAQISIPTTGTLEVWYEPSEDSEHREDDTVPLTDDMIYALATRLAYYCIDHVNYTKPHQIQNKENLKNSLKEQFNDWKATWFEKINRLGSDRPIERLPFRAG